MGPKPFTSSSGDVSFDKVFSVPHVPGSDNMDGEDIKFEEESPEASHEDEKEFLREKDIDTQGKRIYNQLFEFLTSSILQTTKNTQTESQTVIPWSPLKVIH